MSPGGTAARRGSVAEVPMRRQSGSSCYDEAGAPLLRLTWRWSTAFAAIALSAILTTIVVAHVAPEAHPFGGASLHVALETWAALTALVLSLLAYGRYRAMRTLKALVLACAFLALGAS